MIEEKLRKMKMEMLKLNLDKIEFNFAGSKYIIEKPKGGQDEIKKTNV